MDSSSTRRLESLFARALELEPARRATWLASLAGEDAALRTEIGRAHV